jgi:hypothetical protein
MSSVEILRVLDEQVRKYLVDGRELYFHWLLLSTFVVVVGIAMEAPEIVHDIHEELGRFLRRWHKSNDTINLHTGLPITRRRVKLIPFISGFGWLFIVAGVAGEFEFESLTSQSDAMVQSFDNTITQFGVAAANERAAKADATAEAARLEQERLKNENLKLQEQILLMGPRANLLVGEKRRTLVDSLRTFVGHVDVRRGGFIGAVNGISTGVSVITDEMDALIKALSGVLNDAHWKLTQAPLSAPDIPIHGISVYVLPEASPKTRRSANLLVKALRQVPLTVDGPSENLAKQPGPVLDDTIVVFVHPK